MRNRIFGGIGVVWGGAVLIYMLMQGGPQGGGAFAAGQTGGMIFGGLLFIVGLYYLIKGDGSSKREPKESTGERLGACRSQEGAGQIEVIEPTGASRTCWHVGSVV